MFLEADAACRHPAAGTDPAIGGYTWQNPGRILVELDPRTALASLETGLIQLYALGVSYSFSVVGAVILLVVGYIVAGLVERSVSGGLKQIRGFDLTLRHFLAMTARYAVLVLVVVMVLGQFGVQTASIIAAIGAIGLAIGLALQGTLQNIAAGIMLLMLRPFRIGEDVEVGPVTGTVQEIGLFATRLRRDDGVYQLAPNATLWNQPVRNFTRNGIRRNDIAVSLAEGTDVEAAQKELVAIAEADPRVRKQPPPSVLITELGPPEKVALRYWTSPVDFLATAADLMKAVDRRFRRQEGDRAAA
jgi:small conductance mechanosensitive channel